MKNLTLRINDESLIQRIERLAAKTGKDVKALASEIAAEALRRATGEKDLSPAEVAAHLHIHKNTVYAWMAAGKFPHAYYVNQRVVRIPYKDVAAIPALTVKPGIH